MDLIPLRAPQARVQRRDGRSHLTARRKRKSIKIAARTARISNLLPAAKNHQQKRAKEIRQVVDTFSCILWIPVKRLQSCSCHGPTQKLSFKAFQRWPRLLNHPNLDMVAWEALRLTPAFNKLDHPKNCARLRPKRRRRREEKSGAEVLTFVPTIVSNSPRA